MAVIKMKEYQYLIGKIIVAGAIIVAAIIIAQAIGGAGESIRSSLLQLRGGNTAGTLLARDIYRAYRFHGGAA